MSLRDRFDRTLTRLLDGAPPGPLAVACSGGGDSMALLALAVARNTAPVVAVTVDHHIRPESTSEARWVAERAEAMGAAHVTLDWSGWDGQGNLQAEARAARYRLICDWRESARPDVAAVLLGHTADDQAETLLLRLARGSGVDGLSAMAEERRIGATRFLRPLLDERRAGLRRFLEERGLGWIDDPSNDDPRFDRVRARRALDALADLGIGADGLVRTARHMARARVALQARAAEVAARCVTEDLPGIIRFDRDRFAAVERETQLRLLAHGARLLSGAPYRPRLSALETMLDAGLAGSGATAHGTQLLAAHGAFLLIREPRAVAGLEEPADGAALWDGRWRISGRRIAGCTIRALGSEGASRLDRPRDLPHAALVSFPGVWSGKTLVAVPHLWHPALCAPEYARDAAFHGPALSH